MDCPFGIQQDIQFHGILIGCSKGKSAANHPVTEKKARRKQERRRREIIDSKKANKLMKEEKWDTGEEIENFSGILGNRFKKIYGDLPKKEKKGKTGRRKTY